MSKIEGCTCYLGVDPGKKGGLALIDSKLQVIKLELMPTKGSKLYSWLDVTLMRSNVKNLTIVLERVHSMRGQGSQSTFTFGVELGKCETALDILSYERNMMLLESDTKLYTPTPQEWMKAIPEIQSKVNNFSTKTQWKRYLQSVAKKLFPEADLWTHSWWNKGRTDAVSDALLLAYYGWLVNH